MSNITVECNFFIEHIDQKVITEFQESLLSWFHYHGRYFPWRSKKASKYELVISEVLLQRTRAEKVASFFQTFLNKFPSWQELDIVDEIEIGEAIRPIGLWKRRSQKLKLLAHEMTIKNGKFPTKREEIESLPGVGQYIANAILLFCHGKAEPLLDSNMARVLERVFGPRKMADIRYDPYLQELSRVLVRGCKAKYLNWAILDLAAVICLPRKPRCPACPIIAMCLENASLER